VIEEGIEMKTKTIRTNDKCETCGGFLTFEVRDEYTDDRNTITSTGVWKCTLCERATVGLVVRSLVIKVAVGS